MTYEEKMHIWTDYFLGYRELDSGFLKITVALLRENFFNVFCDFVTIICLLMGVYISCVGAHLLLH